MHPGLYFQVDIPSEGELLEISDRTQPLVHVTPQGRLLIRPFKHALEVEPSTEAPAEWKKTRRSEHALRQRPGGFTAETVAWFRIVCPASGS